MEREGGSPFKILAQARITSEVRTDVSPLQAQTPSTVKGVSCAVTSDSPDALRYRSRVEASGIPNRVELQGHRVDVPRTTSGYIAFHWPVKRPKRALADRRRGVGGLAHLRCARHMTGNLEYFS